MQSTVGRISDIRRFNRVYIAQIAFLVVGLSNFVVPLTESFTGLAIDAFIFGLFGGCYLIINPVFVCDILGPQKVSYGLGMTFFVIAIPRTLGPLIAGWIYDGIQSYAIAFYSLGATTCISAILASFVPILLRKNNKVKCMHFTPGRDAFEFVQNVTLFTRLETEIQGLI